MVSFFEVVLVLIIIVLLWVIWKCYQKNEADKKEILALEKEKNEITDFGNGLEEYNKKMQEKKEQAKEKIMGLLKNKDKISNQDTVKLLGISSATSVRYLDELEKEGSIKQVGKTGKKVFYQK